MDGIIGLHVDDIIGRGEDVNGRGVEKLGSVALRRLCFFERHGSEVVASLPSSDPLTLTANKTFTVFRSSRGMSSFFLELCTQHQTQHA